MFDSSSVVPGSPSASSGQPPQNVKRVDTADSASADSAHAHVEDALTASPRSVTTGGNSSPLPVPDNSLAHIDWLAFTIKPANGHGLAWLISELVEHFGIREAISAKKGWFGYATRFDLGGRGLLAYGGKSQRDSFHVELNATGCGHIIDWNQIMEWGKTHRAIITRVDLAHDDLEGQTVSVATAKKWLDAGEFSSGGRPPRGKLIDDLESGEGKTLYVGNRKSGKLCRIYEKGRQLGDASSLWTRVEVEFRNKSRVIPWDVLANPGHYLAGAYPCLTYLSAAQEKIRTISKAMTVSLACAVHHARQMIGPLINVLMQIHAGDAFAVVNELKREGIPRRLQNYTDFLPQILAGGHA